jgi:hypothetical protein
MIVDCDGTLVCASASRLITHGDGSGNGAVRN